MIINPEDIKIELYPDRKSQGGQHVGMSSCGVKVTHLSTGIEATVNIGRSSFANREIAIDMILTALTHPRFK